jgi:hypothetical protein
MTALDREYLFRIHAVLVHELMLCQAHFPEDARAAPFFRQPQPQLGRLGLFGCARDAGTSARRHMYT